MTCTEVRSALLTADRSQLRAEGDSNIASHLRACAPCRIIAIRVEAGTDLLSEMVVARRESGTVMPERRPVRRAIGLALVPIAAAAVFLISRGSPSSAVMPNAATAMNTVLVDAAPDQKATVIKTADPNVTIVWLTPAGGDE